jgi:hypothetical protein
MYVRGDGSKYTEKRKLKYQAAQPEPPSEKSQLSFTQPLSFFLSALVK